MSINITAPSKFHSAYNPIIFKVTADAAPEGPYTLKIGVGKIVGDDPGSVDPPSGSGWVPGMPGAKPPYDENKISLTRPFLKIDDNTYEAKFDISGAIRNYFIMTPPVPAEDVYPDRRLYVQYYVGTTMYVAVNAIFNIGEDSSMDKYVKRILTSFDVLRKYDGYDLDISVLCGEQKLYPFYTVNAVNRANIDRLPMEILSDGDGNSIVDHDGDLIKVNGAKIVNVKPPRNPFYIRWINRLGGVDYWMFGIRQKLTVSVKDVNTLKSYYETSAGASHSETTYGVSNENSIVVGSSNLSIDEWKVLSLMPMSPQIEWYDENLKKWMIVNIKKGDSSRDTDRGLLSVEYTFLLPSYDVQFS